MNIDKYARGYEKGLKFHKGPPTGVLIDPSTGRFAAPAKLLPLGPEAKAFEAAMEAEPTEAHHHLAFADYLQEQGRPKAAEFHRVLADWLPQGLAAAHSGDPASPFSIGHTFDSPDAPLPGGITHDHLPGYPHFNQGETVRAVNHAPVLRNGALHWPSFVSMVRALQSAYSKVHPARVWEATGGRFGQEPG